jgi:hypothetical protein
MGQGEQDMDSNKKDWEKTVRAGGKAKIIKVYIFLVFHCRLYVEETSIYCIARHASRFG